jgi:hypothetical protein
MERDSDHTVGGLHHPVNTSCSWEICYCCKVLVEWPEHTKTFCDLEDSIIRAVLRWWLVARGCIRGNNAKIPILKLKLEVKLHVHGVRLR